MRARLREIAEQSGADPKAALLNSLGDYSGLLPVRYQVLVATYIRPEKTKGGIIRVESTLREDRFQGKVGLILAYGELAFTKGFEKGPDIHDWVIYNPADSFELFFGDGQTATACRLIEDVAIKAVIDNPITIY